MSTERRAPRWLWQWGLPLIIFPSGILVVFALGVYLSTLAFGGHESKVRRLCDQEVEALLTSTDLVEVTRAGIIVNYLDCNISRRLP